MPPGVNLRLMAACPDIVKRLIDRFDQQSDQVRSPDYNETQLRIDFVNPMWAALGWDMDNAQGFAEQYREVVHEDRVKVAGQTKAPDYSFRIGGVRKFFLEAKKPHVNIKEAWEPAYQLRRYGWSAKLAVSVLTDFEEFALYDCKKAPKQMEKPGQARREYFTYKQYVERWDFLEGTFSKRAIQQGDFDRYCQSVKGRGGEEFDDKFLEEIEEWRKQLAGNLALRNEKLDESSLNFSVQRIIDRIIFLRMAEDRGTEVTGQLQALLAGEITYSRLCKIFRDADARYNSGLFHFAPEKGRDESPDTLTPTLEIDDATLKAILRRLYYPESPYEFTVVSADILGSVYERFLGKIITLTAAHRAKIEEKPEVRKAGGVYYTPAYIVQYIVKNTVGKLLEGKTPKDAAKLKVLDPACGSGSFLIGAYQFLLDWHLQQYTAADPQKLATGKSPVLRPGLTGDWRLTIAERKRILLDNIHGVDLDAAAVEVTKLNLLLKCLEGETSQTLGFQQRLFRERALPDLGHNILCGNSLIGTDIMVGDAWKEMSEEEKRRINPFDYERAFAKVFKQCGFDAVIGNPPWGASLDDCSLSYLRKHFVRVIDRMVDTYIFLIDRGLQVKRSSGLLGFIVPATVLNQVDATRIRKLMLLERPQAVISLGKDIFTKKVLNTSAIIILGSSEHDFIALGDLGSIELESRPLALKGDLTSSFTDWRRAVETDPSAVFQVSGKSTGIVSRMRALHRPFSEYIVGSIERGVSPDIAVAHVLRDDAINAHSPERSVLRRSISGPRIGRYKTPVPDQWIIYTTRHTDFASLPRTRAHLKKFEKQNSCREVLEGKHPIWSLHRPRKEQIFESPKFIGLTTTKTIEIVYDPTESLYVTDAMYVFKSRLDIDPNIMLGVLGSRAFLFLYRSSNLGESRVIPQVKAAKLEPLPFPNVSEHSSERTIHLSKLVDNILALHTRISNEQQPQRREQLQREIDATDRQIDQLVYELYGLTPDEIRIVEESTAG
jgi:type I restriction-modification system DNA methylase subunit